MIDVLNRMDGDAAAFDPYLFVDIGNHEFDNTHCQRKGGLQHFTDRVRQSDFYWLSGNLDWDLDVAILSALGKGSPDLIMGGHDHTRMAHFVPSAPQPGETFRAGNSGTVSLINSASFRLNYTVSAGETFRRKHLLANMDAQLETPAITDVNRRKIELPSS